MEKKNVEEGRPSQEQFPNACLSQREQIKTSKQANKQKSP